MAEDLAQGRSEIATLLADRHRLQDWLARLDRADQAPAPVRARVRADYEGRLAEVVSRLRGYTDTLTASLSEVRTRVAALEAQETEVREEQAEARLRHQVGEYDDAEWGRLDGECQARLEQIRGELDGLRGEITELEEVLNQIQDEPATHAEEMADAEDLADVEVLEAETMRLEARRAGAETAVEQPPNQAAELGGRDAEAAPARPRAPEAPRFTPRGGAEPRPRERGPRPLRFPATPRSDTPPSGGGGGGVDEMTFLKSVALESPEAEDPKARTQAGKTLKCSDCGAMNRPTEWYCERCGAELAAL